MLGSLRAENASGAEVVFTTRKNASLLGYLAVRLNRATSRDSLASLFWPEFARSARNNLSVALSSVRKQLEAPPAKEGVILRSDNRTIELGDVWCDLDEFLRVLRRANLPENESVRFDLLAKAADLYRGPLLSGDDEPWVASERKRIEQLYIEAICHMMDMAKTIPQVHRALNYAAFAMSLYPESKDLVGRVQKLRHRVNIEEEARYRKGLGQAVGPEQPISADLFAPAAGLTDGESPGGPVPLGSHFYVERDTDNRFGQAIDSGEGVILLKGPRLVGKTSLLARGMAAARNRGRSVALIDFQAIDGRYLESAESFFYGLAQMLRDQLSIEVAPSQGWDEDLGPGLNLERYLREEILARGSLVCAFDEADRVFRHSFSATFFGLLRSWYNRRAMEPDGVWPNLTLVLAYATEAHLFIRDLNQSPFNVGLQLSLADFDSLQIADLNRRYGLPLKNQVELDDFHSLFGGYPYLVRLALRSMSSDGQPYSVFKRAALGECGPFEEHLRRLWSALSSDRALMDSVRHVLAGGPCKDADAFYRLRAAGVLLGQSSRSARMRCELHKIYLARRLGLAGK